MKPNQFKQGTVIGKLKSIAFPRKTRRASEPTLLTDAILRLPARRRIRANP